MFISKRNLVIYSVLLILVVVVSHFIMIMNRSNVIEKEKEMAVTAALREQQVAGDSIQTSGEKDFFINYRLEREAVRSRHIDTLKEIILSADSTVKISAQNELEKLLNMSELESQIENLLKARGFSDVVMFWSGSEVTVIVLDEEFDDNKATQICDTVSRMLKVDYSNINIIQK